MIRGGSASVGLFVGLVSAAMAACGGDPAPVPNEPPSDAVVVPETTQRDGDPAKGYDLLVNADYVSCGVPARFFEGSGASTFLPAVGLPGEPILLEDRGEASADLPYFLTRVTAKNGVPLVATNCLTCHAGMFDGKLVLGLGNSHIDMTSNVGEFAKLIDDVIVDADEREAYAEWRDRTIVIGPKVQVDTVGVTAADNLAVELFGRRDPKTLAWMGEYQFPVPESVIPVPIATPPLWRMKKKHAPFYTASFRGDHTRFMFAASTLCLDDVSEARAIDEYFPHVRAYIDSLEAPAYPYPIDMTLAAEGERVFVETCSGCHGTYGASPSYPNLVIPRESVGTDATLSVFEEGFIALARSWFEASFWGEVNTFHSDGGYYAPPLDGIWITAPFLHNDSVPTLEALLDSKKRPTYWTRAFLDTEFDREAVGWKYTELEAGKVDGDRSAENLRLYDTTRPGYSNQGHAYGDALTETERAQLMAYLKTL